MRRSLLVKNFARNLSFHWFLFIWLCCCRAQAERVKLHFVNIDGTKSPEIQAEVVSTPGTRQLGLMYRKQLPEQEGMFFIFPDEAPRSFWMKNTYLELDIVFIDSNFQVVTISSRATPLTETQRKSEKPARYVLEIGGGLAEKWRIVAGSRIEMEGKLEH